MARHVSVGIGDTTRQFSILRTLLAYAYISSMKFIYDLLALDLGFTCIKKQIQL